MSEAAGSGTAHAVESGVFDRRLARVQAASGAVFAVFLLMHLANQMSAALGPEVYDGIQRALQRVYQAPAVEVGVVLGSLVVHAGCGVLVKVRRRQAGRAPQVPLSTRLHRWAGNLLLAVVFVHVLVVRGLKLGLDVQLDFGGLAFAFQHMPIDMPLFFLFAAAGLFHAVNGLGLALPRLGIRSGAILRRPTVLAPVVVAGAVLLLGGVLGFGGLLFETPGVERSAAAQLMFEHGLAEPSKGGVADAPDR